MALGPRCFSCSTRMSSLPAALLFFIAATPLFYSLSLKGYLKVSPSVAGGSTGLLGLDGMVPLPMTRS